MSKEVFRKRLYGLMDEHHLNQADVARMCGESRSKICSWLKGTYMPGSESLVKLAKEFGVSSEWLMGESPTYGCPCSDICHGHGGVSLVERYANADEVTRRAIDSLLDASDAVRKSD